ncbi:MAG: hypothetical protein JGK08_22710 [Microcoleus sp. PH2017_04_SCI_O_A]|nr:hypothetical protein [Microcoleus sp. PH2017_04_SCI_O_A]
MRIINSHAQTVTNPAPQRVMNAQQKSAIAKLGHQGTPNQVIGCIPIIQDMANP